jgi:hypothetical protein
MRPERQCLLTRLQQEEREAAAAAAAAAAERAAADAAAAAEGAAPEAAAAAAAAAQLRCSNPVCRRVKHGHDGQQWRRHPDSGVSVDPGMVDAGQRVSGIAAMVAHTGPSRLLGAAMSLCVSRSSSLSASSIMGLAWPTLHPPAGSSLQRMLLPPAAARRDEAGAAVQEAGGGGGRGGRARGGGRHQVVSQPHLRSCAGGRPALEPPPHHARKLAQGMRSCAAPLSSDACCCWAWHCSPNAAVHAQHSTF